MARSLFSSIRGSLPIHMSSQDLLINIDCSMDVAEATISGCPQLHLKLRFNILQLSSFHPISTMVSLASYVDFGVVLTNLHFFSEKFPEAYIGGKAPATFGVRDPERNLCIPVYSVDRYSDMRQYKRSHLCRQSHALNCANNIPLISPNSFRWPVHFHSEL